MHLNDFAETGAVIAVVIYYIFNEIRKEVRIKRKAHKSLDSNVILDAKIYQVLWEILAQYDCMRVYLTQFHNGDNFYTGQSIQRMTISNEVYRKGVDKVKSTHDNILMPEMHHRILMDMQRLGVFETGIDSQDINPDLQEWMTSYGVRHLFYLSITDGKTRETVATLNIHWNRNQPISRQQAFDIKEINKKFEKIFDEI